MDSAPAVDFPVMLPPAPKQDFSLKADTEVAAGFLKNAATGRLPSASYIPARLCPLHCEGDEVHTLSSHRLSSHDNATQVLLTVETERDCLVCYKAPPVFCSEGLSLDTRSLIGNKSVLEAVLCLPLQCASIRRRRDKDLGKERHILELVLPDLQALPQAMQPDSAAMSPVASHGVWILEFDTAGALENMLDHLQLAGCIMQGFEAQYELGQLLGVGSFAKVFYAQDKRTGFPVAAKVVHMKSSADDMALQLEAYMLRQSCHASVLKFVGFFADLDPVDGKNCWIIVTEFIGGGELFGRVRTGGPVSEVRAAFIVIQLLSALKSMHEKGLVHRDIKTENVILTASQGDHVKLVDFGLAAMVSDKVAMARRCGSPGYVAPEVLRDGKYGCKVDCFSVGVLLHILLVGKGPFNGRTLEEVLARNGECRVKQRRISHLSPEAQDVIMSLLNQDPELRPTSAECMKHPWFKIIGSSNSYSYFANGQDGILRENSDIHQTPSAQSVSSLSVEADRNSCIACMSPGLRFTEKWQSQSVKQQTDDIVDWQSQPDEEHADQVDLSTLPLLRSQTPIFADMQETLCDLRASGVSPRTTFAAQDAIGSPRLSARLSGCRRSTGRYRQDGRITERTSVHFAYDTEGEVQYDPRFTASHLHELAVVDVRQSQHRDTNENDGGVMDDAGPARASETGANIFSEDFLCEMPARGDHKNRKRASCTAGSSTLAGSARAVVKTLRRPVKSLPSSAQPLEVKSLRPVKSLPSPAQPLEQDSVEPHAGLEATNGPDQIAQGFERERSAAIHKGRGNRQRLMCDLESQAIQGLWKAREPIVRASAYLSGSPGAAAEPRQPPPSAKREIQADFQTVQAPSIPFEKENRYKRPARTNTNAAHDTSSAQQAR